MKFGAHSCLEHIGSGADELGPIKRRTQSHQMRDRLHGGLEFGAHGIDLAFDGVTGHGTLGPTLGNHGTQSNTSIGKQGFCLHLQRDTFTGHSGMQYKVGGARQRPASQNCLELWAGLKPIQIGQPAHSIPGTTQRLELDSQTLAALGAAGIDDSAATACLHAHQEAVGTGATDFGRLVSTFHIKSLGVTIGVKLPRRRSGKPKIIANLSNAGNTLRKKRRVTH